jgi:hypothetical protein
MENTTPKKQGPAHLSGLVIGQIERLGGVLEPGAPPPTPKMFRTVVGVYALPEPLRQFVDDVRWPQGTHGLGMRYRSRWHDYPHGVQFVSGEIEEAYGCCGTHPYMQVAEDASQFLYFARLDDRRAGNPTVYRIDHEGQDRFGSRWSLAEFLGSLEAEE